MKNTALTDIHIQLGAKMVPFAGYNMPVQYEGINAEHQTVRNAVGVFDVSHMGEFILKGDNALALIQRVTSNDASKLYDGKVQYSCLPNEHRFSPYRVPKPPKLYKASLISIWVRWSTILSKRVFLPG